MKNKKIVIFVLFLFISMFFISCLNLNNKVFATTSVSWASNAYYASGEIYLTTTHPSGNSSISACGDTFQAGVSGYLNYINFELTKTSTPVCVLRCRLYEITPTPLDVLTSIPTGSALAESDTITAADITTLAAYSFTFNRTYYITANSYYAAVIMVESATTISSAKYINVRSAGSPSNSNATYYAGGWGLATTLSGRNLYCSVTVTDTPSVSPTPVSTNSFSYSITPTPTYGFFSYGSTISGDTATLQQSTDYIFTGTVITNDTTTYTGTYNVYNSTLHYGILDSSILLDAKTDYYSGTFALNKTGTFTTSGIGSFNFHIVADYYYNSNHTYQAYKVNGTLSNGYSFNLNLIIIGAETQSDFKMSISGGGDSQKVSQAPIETKLRQTVTYTATGYIYVGNALSTNGTYQVSTSELSISNAIFSSYSLNNTFQGSVTNGVFSFTITSVIAPDTVYQKIRINYTLTNGITGDFYYNIGFYVLGSTANPTGIGGNNNGTGQPLFSGNLLASFILIIVFALIFGAVAGKDGLLVGLIVAIFIDSVSGLLPIYGLILCVVIGGVLVVSHTGLPNSGGTGQ